LDENGENGGGKPDGDGVYAVLGLENRDEEEGNRDEEGENGEVVDVGIDDVDDGVDDVGAGVGVDDIDVGVGVCVEESLEEYC